MSDEAIVKLLGVTVAAEKKAWEIAQWYYGETPAPVALAQRIAWELDQWKRDELNAQAAAEQEREQCAIEAAHWYDGKAAAKAIRARS